MDPTVIAAAIVTVIAALVAGVVTVMNAMAASSDRKDARRSRDALERTTNATNDKANTLIEKTAEIHTLTNSTLSKVTAALENAMTKIEGLQEQIRMVATAKLEADRRMQEKSAAHEVVDRSEKILGRIDDKTQETAPHTAKDDTKDDQT